MWENFQGDSRASFADYTGEERVVTILSAYSGVTTFLVYTKGCIVSHTSILWGQGASWAGIALKSTSWAVCGDGAWATWILVCWAILNGERAPSHSDSGISNTTGGHSAWLTAAASGRAASMSKRTSGWAAHGWDCTRPGLQPPAILASPKGSVNCTFFVSCPEGDPEKESR